MKILDLVKESTQDLLQSQMDFVHLAKTASSMKIPSSRQQTPTECIIDTLALHLALITVV
jgi:hypothetical protein